MLMLEKQIDWTCVSARLKSLKYFDILPNKAPATDMLQCPDPREISKPQDGPPIEDRLLQ